MFERKHRPALYLPARTIGVREAALAHKYKSETTAAYQRGQKLEKRRALMKDWAQFLAGSNVIPFREVG